MMSLNKIKFENCQVKKAIVSSNSLDSEVDLRKCIQCEYEESLFNDTVQVNFIVANVAGTTNGSTLMEGLPLVGTEDFNLVIADPSDNIIDV